MSITLRTFNFYLSTRERDTGTEVNNATWTLNEPLSLNGEIPSQFRVYVNHATIPFSFYQWNDYTNTSKWTLTQGINTYSGQYTIEKSNYTALTFKNEVVNKLATSIQTTTGISVSLTGTYDAGTNKYTFSLGALTPSATLTLGEEDQYDYIDRGLGFIDSWTLTSGSSTTSDSMVNVNPARNLYLWSNNLFSRNYEAINSPVDNSTNLCVIPIYTQPSTYIVYDPPKPIVNDLSNGQITAINLQIKSENIPQNLQNFYLDYSVSITVEEITTNFVLEDHRKKLEEYQERAKLVLQQQLDLNAEKDDTMSKLQKMKDKESRKISRLIDKENAKLKKQQEKEERLRVRQYKTELKPTERTTKETI